MTMRIFTTGAVRRLAIAAALAAFTPTMARLGAQQPAGTAGETCTGRYVIGAEDVLDVAVWDNTALTRTVPVRPDGQISLPLVNDIQAAGLTPMQLRQRLTEALTPYIPEPSVSVVVREIHSFKVSVIGQVRTPGRYELKDRATVLDVLAMAGGLTEYAARGRIVILRQENGAKRSIAFPYDRLTSKAGSGTGAPAAADDLCLKPGDVILVP